MPELNVAFDSLFGHLLTDFRMGWKQMQQHRQLRSSLVAENTQS